MEFSQSLFKRSKEHLISLPLFYLGWKAIPSKKGGMAWGCPSQLWSLSWSCRFLHASAFQINVSSHWMFCCFSFSLHESFLFFYLNRYVSSNCSCSILVQILIRAASLISWRGNYTTCNLFPCYGIVKCEVSVHQLALKYHNCLLRNSRYLLPCATFVPSPFFKTLLGALQHSK